MTFLSGLQENLDFKKGERFWDLCGYGGGGAAVPQHPPYTLLKYYYGGGGMGTDCYLAVNKPLEIS